MPPPMNDATLSNVSRIVAMTTRRTRECRPRGVAAPAGTATPIERRRRSVLLLIIRGYLSS
jgi:hypothetical protein